MPEHSRCLAVKGAELILAPPAARIGKWPRDPAGRRKAVADNKKLWILTHTCRARDNGTFVALCNSTGRSAVGLKGVQANHAGGCLVFNPYGDLIAQSRSRDIAEEMIVVELNGDLIAERRREACFNLQTRRPEVFKALCEPTA